MFEPASREKISIQIVQQIRSAIMSGDLQPGQALPAEKDLMAQFDVSKHTLREALRSLEGLGFVTIKRGAKGGPVVSEIDWVKARSFFASFLYFQKFTLADISEVRKLIEPYIARRAAEVMTQNEIDELVAVHEKCVTAFQNNEDIIRAESEVEFHVLLGKNTRNPILWVTLDFVNNMLADAKHHLKPGKEFAKQVLEDHQCIIDAITSHEPDMAATAMYDHICRVEDDLKLLEK